MILFSNQTKSPSPFLSLSVFSACSFKVMDIFQSHVLIRNVLVKISQKKSMILLIKFQNIFTLTGAGGALHFALVNIPFVVEENGENIAQSNK